MAERLNTLGAEHWELFSQQNYFDKRGVFFCTLVSGPLVLILLVVLVSGGAGAGQTFQVEQTGAARQGMLRGMHLAQGLVRGTLCEKPGQSMHRFEACHRGCELVARGRAVVGVPSKVQRHTAASANVQIALCAAQWQVDRVVGANHLIWPASPAHITPADQLPDRVLSAPDPGQAQGAGLQGTPEGKSSKCKWLRSCRQQSERQQEERMSCKIFSDFFLGNLLLISPSSFFMDPRHVVQVNCLLVSQQNCLFSSNFGVTVALWVQQSRKLACAHACHWRSRSPACRGSARRCCRRCSRRTRCFRMTASTSCGCHLNPPASSTWHSYTADSPLLTLSRDMPVKTSATAMLQQWRLLEAQQPPASREQLQAFVAEHFAAPGRQVLRNPLLPAACITALSRTCLHVTSSNTALILANQRGPAAVGSSLLAL